jgi:class 3 adenylate cyclase
VVLAARIADRAPGGEILVSDAVKQEGLTGKHGVYAVPWSDS